MQRYYPSNSHKLQVDTLRTKKRFHKSAGSIHLNYQTDSEVPQNTQQNQSLKRFKHINKLNVSIDTISDYAKLDRTLKIFRRRIDTLVTKENNVYYYDREEEKILIKMLYQLQKRVHTIHQFMLNSRTTKTINKIRSLNHLTVLLDEFEDDSTLYTPITKIVRLKDLKTISVISQNPERVDFFLQKIKKTCLFSNKEKDPEIGVMIPGWSGVVQQPLEIKNLFGIKDLKYMSIVCYDGLNSLAQAFKLDSKSHKNANIECLKLKLCPIFCGYSSDEEEEETSNTFELSSLGNFGTIKKLELVITPRGIFGRTPTKDVTKLLKSLAFPRYVEELSVSLQEILLDEENQAEEIALSLVKILSPLVHLKSLQLQLLYAGDIPAFFEEQFAGLFKKLVSLQDLQFIMKMQNSSSVPKVFQAGAFLSQLGAHRNLKSIELEAPVLTVSGFRNSERMGFLPKLKEFSLKGAGSIGTTQLDGESIVNFLANLAVKDLEKLNLDFSCCMNIPNVNELITQFEKMERIRELKLNLIWEEYSAFERLVNVLHGKEYLKEMNLEFPRWKAGRKYAKIFFDLFSRGCHEDIQKFSFVSKSFSALRIPKKNALEEEAE